MENSQPKPVILTTIEIESIRIIGSAINHVIYRRPHNPAIGDDIAAITELRMAAARIIQEAIECTINPA